MTLQLDLFAEAEAAEREALADQAPCLFGSRARGYQARVAENTQRVDKYGGFDWYRRSHAWHPCITAPAGRPAACRPTLLMAALHCGCRLPHGEACQCVGNGGGIYRGACLHCSWEGAPRRRENSAVEDAHDHAWPGWRDLTVVTRPPERTGSVTSKTAQQKWADTVNAVYPAGWLKAGGPILTSRAPLQYVNGHPCGARHVPDRTGFGGYDICIEGMEAVASGAT